MKKRINRFLLLDELRRTIEESHRHVTGLTLNKRIFTFIATALYSYLKKNIGKINTTFILPCSTIFRDRATVVFWGDGTKTVTRCTSADSYDKEKGFLMAYFQKTTGMSKKRSSEFFRKLREIENHTSEPKKHIEERYLTAEEAGKYLRMSTSIVYALARKGVLESSYPDRGNLLFTVSGLDEYVNGGKK